jgi:hypothetical protein
VVDSICIIMIEAYDHWHVNGWCAVYPNRFIPWDMPPFDVNATVADVRRLAAKGWRSKTPVPMR